MNLKTALKGENLDIFFVKKNSSKPTYFLQKLNDFGPKIKLLSQVNLMTKLMFKKISKLKLLS